VRVRRDADQLDILGDRRRIRNLVVRIARRKIELARADDRIDDTLARLFGKGEAQRRLVRFRLARRMIVNGCAT
jgi:hypothetical protein